MAVETYQVTKAKQVLALPGYSYLTERLGEYFPHNDSSWLTDENDSAFAQHLTSDAGGWLSPQQDHEFWTLIQEASDTEPSDSLVSWLGAKGALIAAGSLLPILLVFLWPSLRRIDAEAVIAEEPLELLRKIEIFAELPEPVLERLAAEATPISVAADQVVVSRGEAGNHFYAIASGRAAVERDDGTTRELEPGDFFGEIALLRDVRRTATVRATEPLRLYALERDEFLTAVTGHAPTAATAESIVMTRLPAGALAG